MGIEASEVVTGKPFCGFGNGKPLFDKKHDGTLRVLEDQFLLDSRHVQMLTVSVHICLEDAAVILGEVLNEIYKFFFFFLHVIQRQIY